MLAVLLAASGCGDDDDAPATNPPRTQTTETAPSTEQRTTTSPSTTGTAPTSPEDRPGGAGDEDGARSPAMFTGRAGQIKPRVVRVPPFLAIRAELRSADGRAYGLRFGRKTVQAGGPVGSASTVLDGLRPGKSISGIPVGGGSPVRIEASAEPGP